MFIGWIRKKSFYDDLTVLSEKITIDQNLITKTVDEDQSLAFGAYENGELLAIITAYSFKDSILINNLYYVKEIAEEIIVRLFKLLLNNIDESKKTIMFLASVKEQEILKEFSFKKYANFKKAIYKGGAVAFNFSNATAKSISNPNYLGTIKNIDSKEFNEDRFEYITNTTSKGSSLFLSTQFGFQHSYAINNNIIKISPWMMEDEAYTDSEKLLRGVLYHRGLKTVVAFIPKDIKEIVDLYESYKFELTDEFGLLYLNKKPNINLASVYGF
jgi:hypothetical protein